VIEPRYLGVACVGAAVSGFATSDVRLAVLLRDSKKPFFSDDWAAGAPALASLDLGTVAFAASPVLAAAGTGACAEAAQAVNRRIAVASTKRPIVMAIRFQRQADKRRDRP
jgi:hypothetical protein